MIKTISNLLFILPLILFAQNEPDTLLTSNLDYIAYPYAFYSPESKLAIGAGGMLYFRTARLPNIRLSKIIVSGYYTTNHQYFLFLSPKIYFPGRENIQLDSRLTYSKEVSKFYGTGGSSPDIDHPEYIMNVFNLYFNIFKRSFFLDNLSFGLIYDFEHDEMRDRKLNPFLRDETLLGINGGQISGLGVNYQVDLRDNTSYPAENGLYQISAIFYGPSLGSDFSFNVYEADLRHYFSFPEENILADNLYGKFTEGQAPFYRLPRLGGSNRMRGYFEGRYRDKHYIMAQVEYRRIVWWRLGVAVFYGIGEVASDLGRFRLNAAKHSYGFGLRFVFDEKERINLRADIGFGQNSNGIYFNLEEAF